MRPVAVQHTRPVWAEVSSEALCANYRRLCAAAGPGIDVLAVVKANAYGHGAAEFAPVLFHAGARWFGVTAVLALRNLKCSKSLDQKISGLMLYRTSPLRNFLN